MTHEDYWSAVLGRISLSVPVDLDALLGAEPATASGPSLTMQDLPHPPSSKVWEKDDASWSYIGVRIPRRTDDAPFLAARLAAAAMERKVVPILLTSLDRSGFERFGFRIERLPEGSPELVQLFEEELAAFWDLAIVINLEDVVRLG